MWRNTLMKKQTNLTHLGRTTTNTRSHADLTISLLFVSYFYTKKRNKATDKPRRRNAKDYAFRGRESGRRNSPTSDECEGKEQE